jgi:glycosyltransferase involved in cell wall biosynthesis
MHSSLLNGEQIGQTPLISIVTPSFNQAEFIAEAIASVRLQSYRNYEHLIVDGMSTDGTVAIIRALATGEEQTAIAWISEQDSGQSEALNKGFRRAKGEIIGWLNSDDRYLANCFEHVVKAFEDNPDVDIIYGDYRFIDESGKLLRVRREIDFNAFILLYLHILYIPTTATFFRRRIFDEGNLINESLQYAMDLDFFLRLEKQGYRFKHIPWILADFRLQQSSKTCSFPEKQKLEHEQIVLAAAPICRRVESVRIKKMLLMLLRSIASLRRYSEKLLRGYYWDSLWAG